MFQIRKLGRSDFDFAINLANTMDWNMAAEDFEFMNRLEPDGSFLLYDGSDKLGIATAISYGKVGWLGNLIVKEGFRGGGGGSAIVTHAINFLYGKGVQTIGLYAYPHLIDFYGGLGFRQNEDFSVLHAEKVGGVVVAERLTKIEKHRLLKTCEFDKECFGGDRTRLLQTIIPEKENLSYQVVEGNRIVGYITATVYPKLAWVGPLICQPQRPDVALSLVKATLAPLADKKAYAVLPRRDAALSGVFADAGFTEDFFVSRMFLGDAVAKNCIYLAESLERG